MRSVKTLVFGAALLASSGVMTLAAAAKDIVVGVSWSNFQEERWKTDEAAIKGALAPKGAKYISADAQGSPTKQLTDVESLISKGASVLIILAMDSEAILPALKKANDEGIPVIAYDREIESPSALYITFNNVEVGRMMARAIEKVKPAVVAVFGAGGKGGGSGVLIWRISQRGFASLRLNRPFGFRRGIGIGRTRFGNCRCGRGVKKLCIDA